MQPIEEDVEKTLMAKRAEMMIIVIQDVSSERKETLESLQLQLQLQLQTDDKTLQGVAAACDRTKMLIGMAIKSLKKNLFPTKNSDHPCQNGTKDKSTLAGKQQMPV